MIMNIKELTEKMNRFVEQKGWYAEGSPRPQTPRNLAVSLSLEASEILECFQWDEQTPAKTSLEGELADVALYTLQLASVLDIDLEKAILDKLDYNLQRSWPNDE